MATVKQILDTALGGRKIEAIKMARTSGIEPFDGSYSGVKIDFNGAGCWLAEHEYRDGPNGYGFYVRGEPYPCNSSLGLKAAKDIVEDLMSKVQGSPVQESAQLQTEVSRLSRELNGAQANSEYYRNLAIRRGSELDTARRMESEYELQLREEQKQARVNEQRLGKSLRQVDGLKEKLEDRNERLKIMAANIHDLQDMVAGLRSTVVELTMERLEGR